MLCDDRFMTASHWNRIGIRHHHGICLPIGSLTTASSSGIGEYLDLIPLIKWLPKTGFDLIQILPINDTGDDASPYMALSANALHPIYLSLRSLPGADTLPEFMHAVDALRPFCHTPLVHYHDVLKRKLNALNIYLDHRLTAIEIDPDFHAFVERHRSWLTPYSIFRTLKHAHGGKAWWDWEAPFIQKSPSLCHSDPIAETALASEILRWRAIQYLCFSQWNQVKAAADAYGVLLTGDVPILINKDSADVWWHPELFSLKKDVGAPPDIYNEEGQHWGFPLFHWGNHRKNHFAWWKERLRVQEELYHLYRLDHLVGFFRLYAIDPHKKASEGTFIPKTPSEWKPLGEEILTMMINATSMLPLGEDLGDVPSIVRQSMVDLGVPGLKVLRWERRWHTDQSFLPPKAFSPESVTTVSTHDSSTLRGWWEEDPTASQRLANDYGLDYKEKLSSPLLFKLLHISHHSGSLFHINLFNEYLSLFPELTHGDPEKERINRPGTISTHNWTYRTKVSLEEILLHEGLQKALKDLSLE
jgi:4-alpha-glucanotransferase